MRFKLAVALSQSHDSWLSLVQMDILFVIAVYTNRYARLNSHFLRDRQVLGACTYTEFFNNLIDFYSKPINLLNKSDGCAQNLNLLCNSQTIYCINGAYLLEN